MVASSQFVLYLVFLSQSHPVQGIVVTHVFHAHCPYPNMRVTHFHDRLTAHLKPCLVLPKVIRDQAEGIGDKLTIVVAT
jgi:hypothetical protein